MGAIEEGGKIAGEVVKGLTSSPAVLAIVVLQVALLGSILYSSSARQRSTDAQFTSLHKLLETCMQR